MKKNYYLVLDVETANTTEDALVYDLGYAVCDRHGEIYEYCSMVVSDVYDDKKELMNTCYYHEKLPKYEEGLKNNDFERVSLYEARKRIVDAIEKYDVCAVCAYNAHFDKTALNTTERYITKSKYRYFLPYGIPVYCIWHMACQVICTQKRYSKFCIENGFLSPKGNILTNAETVYAYINKDIYFEEAHTGLQDVLIETQIMAHCFRQHKKMDKNINRLCWRIPQKKKSK